MININHFKVFVRTRPHDVTELSLPSHQSSIHIDPEKSQIIQMNANEDCKTIKFDGVFASNENQESVFEKSMLPLLEHVQKGGHGTLIVYGQTSSGKTYTVGTTKGNISKDDEGILQRSIEHLLIFEKGKKRKVLQISFLEVYNECVFDLLAGSKKQLPTRGIGRQNTGISQDNLTELIVETASEAMNLLQKGIRLRETGQTTYNNDSSRSHVVISLSLFIGAGGAKVGTLQLVDLAGSESVGRAQLSEMGDRTPMSKQQFKEGVKINTSLLILNRVLEALGRMQGNRNIPAQSVPYRESVLTQLLRESLGGPNLTCMIACISLSERNKLETASTLKYAQMARNIRPKREPLSTIKQQPPCSAIKRHFDDITATPGTYKRQNLASRYYNSAASTPGHQPPYHRMVNSTAIADNTFVSRGLHMKQPVFNDDSTKAFSSTSTINEEADYSNSFMISPLVHRISSRLEQSMIEHFEKRANLWEEKIMDVLARKLKGRTSVNKSSKGSSSSFNFMSMFGADFSSAMKDFVVEQDGVQEEVNQHLNIAMGKIAQTPLKNKTLGHDLTRSDISNILTATNTVVKCASVRRSARLSVMRKPLVMDESLMDEDSFMVHDVDATIMHADEGNVETSRSDLPAVANADTQNQNRRILHILNYGDRKRLQQLPTIGPKTAIIIDTFRMHRAPLKTVEDLKIIPGLTNNFCIRFMKANMLEEF